MSLRGLLVLLAVLAGAIALVILLKPQKTPKPAEEGPLLAPFDEAKVERIDLACGNTVTLERAAKNGWRLTAPEPAEADPRVVHTTLTALEDARVRKVIAGPGTSGRAYGLDPATCRATLTVAGEAEPRTLSLGRTSPVGTERYALDAKGRVVFADGSVYTALAKPASDFRERRLIPVEPETITAIELDRPSGGPLAVERSGSGWRLTAPVEDVAADTACADLARAVATMEVDEVRPGLRPEHARPDRRIGVRVTVSGEAHPERAFVATAGVEGKRLAWREGGGFAGLVPEQRAQELEHGVDTYRDPHPASFSSPDVRAIAITRAGAPLRVTRTAEGAAWTVAEDAGPGRPADPARVDAFVDTIRWATATGFAAAPPPTPATGRIAVSGEKGKVLADLTWGPLPPAAGGAESVWIETPARPGVVFEAKASAFGPIPAKASDLLPQPSSSPAPQPSPSPTPPSSPTP